ncbi:MAG: hypothetical protein KJ698_05900 [Actinobacteria bacterium]|nr:hypothetical protein [Actinomycetota bacterium]
MSELERVQRELTRLTERLREVKNRKDTGGIGVPQPGEPAAAKRPPLDWQQPERPTA